MVWMLYEYKYPLIAYDLIGKTKHYTGNYFWHNFNYIVFTFAVYNGKQESVIFIEPATKIRTERAVYRCMH